MKREWEPGDVAIISWQSQSKRPGGTQMAMRCSREYDESHWQTQTFGEIPDRKVTEVRPLVVIDPEDRKQVERLTEGYIDASRGVIPGTPNEGWMQTALRSLIASPRPDEPTGLGAVVEDEQGVMYVRVALDDPGYPDWKPSHSMDRMTWLNVPAVKVLSEGVTP